MTKMAAAAETSAAVTFWERYKMLKTPYQKHIDYRDKLKSLRANRKQRQPDYMNLTSRELSDIAINGTDAEAYALYCFMTEARIAKGKSHGPVKTFEQWMKD